MALFLYAFLVVTIALFWVVIWLLGRLVGLMFSCHVPFAPFGWTILGCIILISLILCYGFFIGRWRLSVTHLDYGNGDIPAAFDGYRIVQISDLHLGTFDDAPAHLDKIVDTINGLHPDLICFTGDLVTMGAGEAGQYAGTLSKLTATDGVVSVLGNHDFLLYSPGVDDAARHEQVEGLADFERKSLGWRLLRNENMTIRRGEEAITIIGVDNQNCSNQGFRTIACGDLPKASEGCSGFRILLSHDPSHWSAEVVPDTDIQLTLSGHTHAAQVRLFGWTPAKVSFTETDGRYDRDGQTLYINIGLGCTAPFRLGANPEITLITLRSQQN